MKTEPNNILTPEEIRQVRRYCLLPALPLHALFGALLAIAAGMLLVFLDESLLDAKYSPVHGLFLKVLAGVLIVLCLLWLGILVYSLVAPAWGMRRIRWLSILHKLDLRPGVAGAETAAFQSQVPQPPVEKYQRALLIFPVLLVALLFIPEFLYGHYFNRREVQAVTDTMEQLEELLRHEGDYCSWDEPKKFRHDHCTLYWSTEDDPLDRRLYIGVDRTGMIKDVAWIMDEDADLSPRENLELLAEHVETYQELLFSSGIPVWTASPDAAAPLESELVTPYLEHRESCYESLAISPTEYTLNYTGDTSHPYLYYTARLENTW